MKFGGTSVGSAERMRALAARVRERLSKRPVLVVSALGGITDLLIRGARFALHRDPASDTVLKDVVARHEEVVRDLVPAGDVRNRLLAHVEAVAGERGEPADVEVQHVLDGPHVLALATLPDQPAHEIPPSFVRDTP